MKNQVEFMVLVGTTCWTTTNTCKPQLAGLGFHVLTRRQASFGPGFMSWHGGKLPYPHTFAFGFLLSAMPFYFLQCFAAFCLLLFALDRVSCPDTEASSLTLALLPLAFCFLQCLSTFCNALLLFAKAFFYSSKAFRFSLTAFHFPRNPRKFIYGGKYTKDCYLSFVIPCHFTPQAS